MGANRVASWAVAVCFIIGLWGASHAQIGPAPGGGSSSLIANSTVITGGTDGRVLFDDSGVLGENSGLTFTKATSTVTIGDGQYVSNKTGGGYAFKHRSGGTDVASFGYSGAAFISLGEVSWSSSSTVVGSDDIGLSRNGVGVLEINNGTIGTLAEIKSRSMVIGGTVPGISGCTAGTQTGGGTAGTFSSGTTGVCTVVLTFAFTAPTGWNCAANNRTTANLIRQTSSSTTTATIAGTTVTGDVVSFGCMAY